MPLYEPQYKNLVYCQY